MRAIIAGGRNFCWSFAQNRLFLETHQDRINAEIWLGLMILKHKIDFVLCGGATGADALGYNFAKKRGIRGMLYAAKWNDLDAPGAVIKKRKNSDERYNANAGPGRNERMACNADVLLVFPGGSGTADMIRRAEAHGLIIERYEETKTHNTNLPY